MHQLPCIRENQYASHDNSAQREGKLGKGKHGTLRAEKIGKDKHASLALHQDGSLRSQQEEKDEYALHQAGSQARQKKQVCLAAGWLPSIYHSQFSFE